MAQPATETRYRLKLYYETELTRKVSSWLVEIFRDVPGPGTRLTACQVVEATYAEPLTDEQIQTMRDNPPQGYYRVEIEEAP